MKLSCKCLNVIINSKGSLIDSFDNSTGPKFDHPFFKDDIGSVELESIHKEQAALVAVESCGGGSGGGGQWLVHRCLNCHMYTHALDTASTATVLVSRNMLTDPKEIATLRNSEKFSPVFHIVIDSLDEDSNTPIPGGRGVVGSAGLQQQLSEWVQRQVAATEERVRQFSEQQYAALELMRSRAHRDHQTLARLLVEASSAQKTSQAVEAKVPTPQFSAASSVVRSPQRTMAVLPDPTKAIAKRPTQVGVRPRNVARKPSVDAEGLFDLDGMDEIGTEAIASDEELELSDTDESGSHDEGIHIPRHVSSVYAKSLPVNVPVFGHHSASEESPHRHDYRVPHEPMDIAASIKALAKSVHGDAAFGDLPRPRSDLFKLNSLITLLTLKSDGWQVPHEPMDIAASIKALAKSVHGDAVFGDLPRPRFSSQI